MHMIKQIPCPVHLLLINNHQLYMKRKTLSNQKIKVPSGTVVVTHSD